MQARFKLTKEWQSLNGLTGVDGDGNAVTITLAAGYNIKGMPLFSTFNYEWYQGATAPLDENIASFPIGDRQQFFATYDATEEFYLRAVPKNSAYDDVEAECILIVTAGS